MILNKTEPVKPANNLSVFVDTYILYSICCCYLNVTRLLLWIEFSIMGNFEGLNFAGSFIRGSLMLRFFHNREKREIKDPGN